MRRDNEVNGRAESGLPLDRTDARSAGATCSCFRTPGSCLRTVFAVLGLVTLLAMPAGAQSAETWIGQPILEVEYLGTSLSSDTLDHYLFGRGDSRMRALDLELLDERIARLWERELIDDISVEAVQLEGGVKLIFRIRDRERLLSVEYIGLKRIAKSDIKERIDRDRIALYEGQPLQRGELVRLKDVIEEMYREKGFRFAEVRYRLESVSTGQLRATYTIDEGDKVKIGDIDFDGNTVFSDFRLRQAMKKTKESNMIWRMFKKDIYNPANLEEDLDSVRDLYRRKGYKDVLLDKPEIDVTAKRPAAATIEAQKRRLAVTIPVEEGERWKLGEVSIEGNEVLDDAFLIRQFERPRGNWLRSKAIDDLVEKVSKLYQSLGYVFSEVDTELREVGDHVADLVLHVQEKDQFRVGRIEFDGNTKTRDKVLRREMLVQESSVMNMNAMRSSLLKIRQLNYFTLNEDEPIDFDFDAENKTVDLTVKGQEADRTELQFGGGYSEFDGFFGQFAMRTTNFLGRGETVGVSVQIGSERELFDLEYSIPWFLDRPQSLGFRLFDSSLDNRVLTDVDFQQDFSGGSVTYGRNLGPFQSLSFTYSFTDIEQVDTLFDPLGIEDPVVRRTDFTTSSLRPFWIFNTLDSRFEPFRGLRLTGSVEIAGGALGGDTEFLKPVASATWFRPISRRPFKSTFGLNAQVGYITDLQGGDEAIALFSQQRFFLGGENSVRGFRRRSLVVIDDNGDIIRDRDRFPLGGDSFLQVNLEYHVLVGGPFRVVFFGDAGGVFAGPEGFDLDGNPFPSQSFDPDLLRYSAGVELRVLVPLFGAPLRFIYSRNLDPLETDQFESFDFNIGASF